MWLLLIALLYSLLLSMVGMRCWCSIKFCQNCYKKSLQLAFCLYCNFCLPIQSVSKHLEIFKNKLSEVGHLIQEEVTIKVDQLLADWWIAATKSKATFDATETWPIAAIILELGQLRTEVVVTWKAIKDYRSFHFTTAAELSPTHTNRKSFQIELSSIHCFL